MVERARDGQRIGQLPVDLSQFGSPDGTDQQDAEKHKDREEERRRHREAKTKAHVGVTAALFDSRYFELFV